MTEEVRKQTEEAGQAQEEMDQAEETTPDIEPEEKDEEQAEETCCEEPEGQTGEDGCEDPEEEIFRDPETDGESTGDEEDVVDGEFVQAEKGVKKGTIFRKKKDKKDEKIEELTDKVQRQMAEFDNFRKRTEKEKSQMFDFGAKSVIEKILPVIDNFERGLAQAGEDSDDPFVQGMEKVYKQMLTELEAIGVKPIEAEGKEFNPDLHNAVMHCEDDSVGENIVVQELQKGYTYHDTVVRHSMVKVAN